jgi:hypothetical protein
MTLKKQLWKSHCKVGVASRYLKDLRSEQTTNHVEDQQQECYDITTSPRRDWVALQDNPTSFPLGYTLVPYSVLHYVFEDVLDRFKLAMFKSGRRAILTMMQRMSWDSQDSVPVVEFMRAMSATFSLERSLNLSASIGMRMHMVLRLHSQTHCHYPWRPGVCRQSARL